MVAALFVILVILGTGAAFPLIRRSSRQSDLEVAASSFCACLLGRHTGDVKRTLAGVRLAVLLGPPEPERQWPQRCKPFAQPALLAMYAAWRSSVPGADDESWGEVALEIGNGNAEYAAPLLEALQHFWVNEPAPSVPLAPAPAFPRVAADVRPFLDRDAQQLDVTYDDGNARLDFGDVVCTVGADLHSECVPSPVRLVPWRRTYANDRIVAVDGAGIVTESNHGRVTKNPTAITMNQRSTRFIDDWALWKDTHEFSADAKLMVMHLADGASAKAQSLGTLTRPATFSAVGSSARTYAVCRDASLFVDMDPNLAVLTNGAWTMSKLEPALTGRHMHCRGDVAVITEWDPPSARRCDAHGCTPLELPAITGTNEDEFASDGEVLYQLEQRDPAIVLGIQPLSGGRRRLVPIIDAGAISWGFFGLLDRGMLHANFNSALLTFHRKTDGRVIVLAVDRLGTTRVLVAGE